LLEGRTLMPTTLVDAGPIVAGHVVDVPLTAAV